MLGYAEMKEVMIWVQTTEEAKVHIAYHPVDKPKEMYTTQAYQTQAEEAFTARLIANQVEPGNTYAYSVFINDKKVERSYPMTFQSLPLWQWRSDPPDMKIALGSCAFISEERYDRPGKPYGGQYEIFASIHEQKPDFMLWLGDNMYLREADWYSRTGILHRYTHTRKLPEMQALLASTHHYAIWDDHDFGPNNSDRTYRDKHLTLEAFKLFWGNPTYGLDGESGTESMFQWGDLDFFLLDNRYHRTPPHKKGTDRKIIGDKQLDWLIGSLINSRATFKFVCIGGQVINSFVKYENHINIAPDERQVLLDAITENEIKNVIFLTGDRHHSELSLYENKGIKVYDFTVSPLTSRAYESESEPNALRVQGSQYGKRNFGIMEMTGEKGKRALTLFLYDTNGKEVWSQTLNPQ